MNQRNHPPEPEELPLDTCLELLANRQRRRILGFFVDSERDHAQIDEIVGEILDGEAGMTGERPSHDTVAATLFHVHLPRFADANVLDYDTRHLEVRYHGDPKLVELFEVVREFE